jgi:hypothetical protein
MQQMVRARRLRVNMNVSYFFKAERRFFAASIWL